MNFTKGLKFGRLIWTLFVTWYFINFSRNFFQSLAPEKSQIPNIFFLILVLWMALEYYFASPFFQSGIITPSTLERTIFAIFFYVTTIYSIADYSHYNWTQLNILYPVINIIGVILFTIGVLLRYYTLFELIRLPTQKLPKSGFFNLCRHPRYLATVIQIVSIPLVFSSYLGFIISLVIGLPIIYFELEAEEKNLTKIYKDEYNQYKSNVPFIIPKFNRPCLCRRHGRQVARPREKTKPKFKSKK